MENFNNTNTTTQAGIPVQPVGTPIQVSPDGYPQASQVQPNTAPVLGTSATMVGPQRIPKGWATLFKAAIALAAYFLFETVGFAAAYAFDVDYTFPYIFAGSIAGLVLILLLGGKELLLTSGEKIKEVFRFCWWFIAVSAGMALLDFIATVASEETLVDNWPLMILWSLLLCFFIGISEETLTRGIFLHGLLPRMGTSTKGVIWACVLTGLFFGLLHVTTDELLSSNPLDVAQAIGKVLQTGTYGFVLAALSVKTRDVIGVALIHGLDDFLLFVGSAVFYGTDILDVEYVSSGEDGWAALIVYAVCIALYMPLVIRAYRELKQLPVPERGCFNLKRGLNAQAVSARGGLNLGYVVSAPVNAVDYPQTSMPVPPTGW